MRFNRRAGGLLAKRRGACFERDFELVCRFHDITCIRVPDGCKSVGPQTLIRVTTPFDYILGFGRSAVVVDLKTFDTNRLSYSQIKRHQLESLSAMGGHISSGYIVWFRSVDKVRFYSHTVLGKLLPRASLSAEEGVDLGTLGLMNLRPLFPA